MNKQHWIAIGTVVVLHNMGQKTFGMICDREQEKYGLAYTVLTDEHRFEKHFNIADANMKGIGWKIANDEEIAFRAKHRN